MESTTMVNFYSWNDVFMFGKHYGLTVRQIFNSNPEYLNWSVGHGVISLPDEICDRILEVLFNKGFYKRKSTVKKRNKQIKPTYKRSYLRW